MLKFHNYFKSVIIVFLIISNVICTKDPNNNKPQNSNSFFKCPSSSTSCPFKSGSTNWVWLNSPIKSHVNNGKLAFPNLEIWESGMNLYYNQNIHSSFTIELKDDCKTIGLRDYNSKQFIRDISVVVNDSILVIKDPIICPDVDCVFLKQGNNSPYQRYAVENQNANKQCNYTKSNLWECSCEINKNGNNCSNSFYEIDILNKETIYSSVFLENKDLIVCSDDGIKRVISYIGTDNKIKWTLDILFTVSFNESWTDYNQQNLMLWNDKILYFFDFTDGSGSFLKCIVIDQTGKISDTKSYRYPSNRYRKFINASQLKNGNIFVAAGNGAGGNNYTLLNSKLEFLSSKSFMESPISRNFQQNHFFVFEDHIYFFYPEASSGKFSYYQFDSNMNFVKNGSIITTLKELPITSLYFYKLQDKLLIKGYSNTRAIDEGLGSPDLWAIYDIKSFNKLSSNFYYSSRPFLNSFLSIIEGEYLYTIGVGSPSNQLAINKYFVANGKWIYQYVIQTVPSKYEPITLISCNVLNNNLNIFMNGIYFNQSLIKYSFNENSLYPGFSCK